MPSAYSQLWTVHPIRVRYFPITFSPSGEIVYPELAYPYVTPRFSSLVAGMMCALIPIAVILICQIHPRVRSFRDASNGLLGLTYSLVTGTFFQVVLKKSIGGFRPHFLSVCEPDVSGVGVGFQTIMFTSAVCRGNPSKIQNAMESFPSGHSQIAFAGLLYLAIYLNAHLRVFSFSATALTRRPRHWMMLAVVAPVLLATYLASTLVLGHHHHAYDVIFGSLIGSVMAISSYKMVFVSIFDGMTNCKPLSRGQDDTRAESDLDPVLPTTRLEAETRV